MFRGVSIGCISFPITYRQPRCPNSQRCVVLGASDVIVVIFETHNKSKVDQEQKYDAKRRYFEP
jgi:hypothetical protein